MRALCCDSQRCLYDRYAQAHLPSDDIYPGITIDASSVSASPVTNYSVSGQYFYPDDTFGYCNVNVSYSHDGLEDTVALTWLPTPDKFQNRWLSTGGGGYAINSGSSSVPGGIVYGAAAGYTDGGFGMFQDDAIEVFLIENGTINWHNIYMFGYQAHHELSAIGKAFTKNFFNMSDAKLYVYYQGCSEGGREGWSQIQRFGDEWDGAVVAAPAFRFSFQQVQHLYSNVVEQSLNYKPPPCELTKIVNETIKACDSLDGETDGVVSRTDLCKLNFDIASLIGTPYYCAAAAATSGQGGSAATPVQNGTIAAQGEAVAKEILKGIRDSEGEQVYFSYTISSTFSDATTVWNSTSNQWEISITSLGGSFVEVLLDLKNGSNIDSLSGVTYDTLCDWIWEGWNRYADSLQTNWPDLTPFNKAGGKIIHFHGESDFSIPSTSSVYYHESVRKIMYPDLSFNDSTAALSDWYRLFLVPGAGHCAPSSTQPNGPWPQTSLQNLIDWVENDIVPTTLNATVLQGDNIGQNQQLCAWPLRPLWTGPNGTSMECIYDQTSIDSWKYNLTAFKMPVY
ncbi:putative tannase subunit [Phaeomoniella chlamydospora]|uniref:Carboxylic ester hydrolase n=1 Tax=Phaeomoniella chlamydospora TaxID=158046 RepID=A0A0G2EAW7_PHACM|nr:putative tannase subunit [Phaeomoniella chlamydospora]